MPIGYGYGARKGFDDSLFKRALMARIFKNNVQPNQMDESGRSLLRDNTFQRQQQVSPVASAPDRPGILNRLISGTGAALHEGLTAIQLGPEGYRQKIYQQNVLEPLKQRMAEEEERRWQGRQGMENQEWRNRQGMEFKSQKDLLQYKQSLEKPKELSPTEQAQMRLLQNKATPQDMMLLAGLKKKEPSAIQQRATKAWEIEQKKLAGGTVANGRVTKEEEAFLKHYKLTLMEELNQFVGGEESISPSVPADNTITKESLIQQGFTPSEAEEYLRGINP